MVMHPHTKYNWPIWKDKKSYGPDKLRWEEAEAEEVEAEEKIRLKQYVSLHSKGRHNKSDEVQTSSNLLSQIFKHDIAKEKSSVGSILDQAKVNILANSWQCKNQERGL